MPRVKKQKSFDELVKNTNQLSKQDMKKLITAYIKENGGKMDARFEKIVLTDLDEHLKELNINDECPYCHSKLIVANGKRPNGIQRLKCCDCGKSFTHFTGTFLEKTKFSWDIWIEVIYQMIKETSITDMKQGMIDDNYLDFVTRRTIWVWQRKILSAVEQMKQPELHGVIQVDETHYHESQKGVNEENLVSVLPGKKRHSRHHYSAAAYGPMGSEFTTVVTAIDKSGHCVGKVLGLGKFKTDQFTEVFRPHIKDCEWLCTDKNSVYSKYCDDFGVNHYIRPSDYIDNTLGKTAEECEAMFNENELDYIEHKRYSYDEIEKIKYKYGLNLGLVNELHKDIRRFINKNKHGVSSKYLNSWIAWIMLLKNFAVDNGHYPASKKDAEMILTMLLKEKTNVLCKDIVNVQLNLPKPTDRELKALMANTEKGRKLAGRKRFVFTEEDLIDSNGLRDVLYKIPLKTLKEICNHYYQLNHYSYKGYSTYLKTGKRLKYVQKLEKEKDIKDIMFKITAENGKDIYSSEEDPIHRKPNDYKKYSS